MGLEEASAVPLPCVGVLVLVVLVVLEVVVVAVAVQSPSPEPSSMSRGDGGSLLGGVPTGVAGAETVRSRREIEPSLPELPLSLAESALSISISGSLECDLVRGILLGRSRLPSLLSRIAVTDGGVADDEVVAVAACSGGKRGVDRELGEREREMFGILTTCGDVGADTELSRTGI